MTAFRAAGAILALVACCALAPFAVADPQADFPTDPGATGVQDEAAQSAGRAALVDRVDAQPGPIDPDSYVLGPGDILTLQLWGAVDRKLALEIDPEGRVFLPGVGPIAVSSLTLADARARLLREVDKRYRSVRADIGLTVRRRFKVYVTGEVRSPGGIEVTATMRASEGLVMVGLLPDASRRNIEVRHRDGTWTRVDLVGFETGGLMTSNPFLVDGDVLQVPKRLRDVQVEGAVAKSGRYELAPLDSLRTLLQIAGGFLPSARQDSLLVVRFRGPSDRESLWVRVPDLVSGRVNPALSEDDHVFVYYTADWRQLPMATVVGEVMRPGVYPFALGRDRLGDLLRWAGGFGEQANQQGLYLTRISAGVDDDPGFQRLSRLSRTEMTESEYAALETKLSERRNVFRVDFSRILAGSQGVDPLLENGDVIRVDRMVRSVRVEGQVRRPGFIEYRPGRTVSDYVALAGGFTTRASHSRVRLAREQTGQVFPARSVQVVQPGDFLWVPEVRDVDAWQVFKDVLTISGQIAIIIVTAARL